MIVMSQNSFLEDYPTEIAENLAGFMNSVGSVQHVIHSLMSLSKGEHLKLCPLEQAKLDLLSAYALNSLFWMYLLTQGVNPKHHGIKQELERIRTYMNRIKDITDKKRAVHLDRNAASRFVRNALWVGEDTKAKKSMS